MNPDPSATAQRTKRPRLAPKARLRLDRRGGSVLLYPERGLALNETAAAIIALCDGRRTIEEIVAALERSHGGAPAGVIEAETRCFLVDLAARGLLLEGPG